MQAIISASTTAITRGTTLDNRAHLAPEFVDQIVSLYQGTRFAAQEIEGRLIDQPEGAWFARFDTSKHVQLIAYLQGLPVLVAIDAGTSRTTAALFFQSQRVDQYRVRFLIHDAYLAVDKFSEENALAIARQFGDRFSAGELRAVYIDAAASQRTSIGPVALGEYQRVFGERRVIPIYTRSVTDDLDQIDAMLERGDLIIHPRAQSLIDALKNYSRQARGGEWADIPAPSQSPWEDSIDALRYGVRGVMPEGRAARPTFSRVDSRRLI
jgi:hypothetical protein